MAVIKNILRIKFRATAPLQSGYCLRVTFGKAGNNLVRALRVGDEQINRD